MQGTIKVKLVKSPIGCPRKLRKTLIGVGLTKMHKTVVRKKSPEFMGMLTKVAHLIDMEE